MKRVLVVTAVDVEARGLARHLGLSPVAGATFPHFGGGSLEIVAVGLRAAHLDARGAHLDARAGAGAPSLVVSAGTCAALAPGLTEGALIVPEIVLTADGARRVTAPLPGLTARGSLISVSGVLESAEAKSRLWLEHAAAAADMESAAVLDWAARRGAPAGVVRGVSDTAERGVPSDLAAVVGEDGRVRTFRAVSAVLARPRAAADALALRAGTAAALKAVAAALATVVRAHATEARGAG